MQLLKRRGLYATALENAKLLFSLDHGDPESVHLFIDFLAIKAARYDFLWVASPQHLPCAFVKPGAIGILKTYFLLQHNAFDLAAAKQ